ncbi:TPA: hypothetical protein ACGD69_004063 [Serratia marcescens]|uniref:hypothetical protein n=1 Tax=Serratia marcescens TaxID=615 RepID=UPI00307C5DBE
MDNKLSELSKPVAYKFDHGVMGPGDFKYGTPQMHSAAKDENASPLYSQEYVSALRADAAKWFEAFEKAVSVGARYEERIAELEQAMRHIHGAALDITVPRVAIAKAAELAVEHASMKEQSNG